MSKSEWMTVVYFMKALEKLKLVTLYKAYGSGEITGSYVGAFLAEYGRDR